MSNIDVVQDDDIFNIGELQLFLLPYADDAVLFAKSKEALLQSMLIDLEIYFKQWGLTVNTSKAKVMVFENGKHTINKGQFVLK